MCVAHKGSIDLTFPNKTAVITGHGEDLCRGYTFTFLRIILHIYRAPLRFAKIKKRAMCRSVLSVYKLCAQFANREFGFTHSSFFPPADPSGDPWRSKYTGLSLHQREIQIMISSLRANLQLKVALCTASSTNLLGTSSLAHVFYTSKSEVKLFQLGPQRHSGCTNLLMKELIEPITLLQKTPQQLIAVVHDTYSSFRERSGLCCHGHRFQ